MRKASKKKKRKDFSFRSYEKRSVSQNAATESLFLAKLSSSNVKAVALTRAPEN